MKKILTLVFVFTALIGINTMQTFGVNNANNQSLSILSIDNDEISLFGEKDITVTLQNSGNNAITSFEIQYSINGLEPITELISNVNIEPGDTYTHIFSKNWDATPGEYDLTVKLVSVNHEAVHTNNLAEKKVYTASRSVQNRPMFEHFTASTCPPCTGFNNAVNPFYLENEHQLSIVKYPMNWPGTGDPYYTAEGGVRRTYYSVSGVPALFVGGSSVSTSIGAVTTAFNNALAKPAFFEIDANAVVNTSNVIEVEVEVTPHTSASNIRLHAAIIEKTTYGNTGSNGETVFHYVMMKMLPDAQGTTFSATDGEVENFEFTIDLTNTFVEEFEDLALVVFIQNHNTKEVLQSFMDDVEFRYDDIDLLAKSVDVNKFLLHGETDVVATVMNQGIFNLTSFDIEYSVDGTPVVESVSGVDLVQFETYEYTFNQKWNATSGKHDIKVKISNVNGDGEDENTYNDEIIKSIYVGSKAVINTPMLEQFSSSTSAPSADFNEIFNPFIAENIENLSIIKYPVKAPGSGDPYYTGESGKRISYYDVDLPPVLFVDGLNVAATADGFENAFANSSSKNALVELDFTSSIDNNSRVYANIEVKSYVDVNKLTLYGAVVENETTGNVGNNGETSFKYTMIKMIPNADGTEFNITDGETKEFELSASLKNTKVEDLDNLSVVFFVQFDESKDILQSKMAALGTGTNVENTLMQNLAIYPNPSQGDFTIQSSNGQGIVSVEIYNLTGSIVYSESYTGAQNQVQLSINQPKGMYMVKMITEDGQAVIGKLIVQ